MGSACVCSKAQVNLSSCRPEHSQKSSSCTSLASYQPSTKPWAKVLEIYSSTSDPIKSFSVHNSKKFKNLLISGPPAQFRWSAWKSALNYSPIQIPTLEISAYYLSLIEQDVPRTFPFHEFFQQNETLEALKEVLINTARLNPALGYTQGMNFVAGVFLLVSNKNVFESSGMMHVFLNNFEGKGLFEPGFPRLSELTKQFSIDFKKKLPNLFGWFKDIQMDSNLWLTKWFMTLFAYSFDIEIVVRFWDLIFANGLDSMLNISVSVLSALKKKLMTKGLIEALEFLKGVKSSKIDFEAVIAISKIGLNSRLYKDSLFKETEISDGLSDSDVEIQLESSNNRRFSFGVFSKSKSKAISSHRKSVNIN